VRKNIRKIRDDIRHMAVTELSAKMSELGRSIPPLGIHRIESGERRVDVDDLMAFAVALKVSPVSLLMPASSEADGGVEVTGRDGSYSAEQIWEWLCATTLGYFPVEYESPAAFFRGAWPQWKQEREREWLDSIDDVHARLREKTRQLAMREHRGDG